MLKSQEVLVNREISWLSFNERVLQEAMDESNPLIERVRFLGIFSNNRDEFFRVRVATVKRMTTLGKKARQQLYDDPEELLKQIKSVVLAQEEKFHTAFADIVAGLEKENIFILDENEVSEEQREFVLDYFKLKVRPTLVPLMMTNKARPELTDKASYLAIKLAHEDESIKNKYALMEIPARTLPRFLVLPKEGDKKFVMFLDDVIRMGLSQVFKIFDYTSIEAYAIRMTRDAELDIDEDIDESIMEKMSKSVSRRKKAQPVRFVHDRNISSDLLEFLIRKLKLTDNENIIPSGRYHNLRDFMSFPNVGGPELENAKWEPTRHVELNNKKSLIQVIRKKDILLHYPFQAFSHTIDILREAAIDPAVTSIKINLYRVAHSSKVMNALINASKNGKSVTAVVELRARFDEENNIYWSRKLQENGVKVIFGVEGLKVHSKLVVIARKAGNKTEYIAHIGTGNFHEGTAKLYTDVSLWTANQRISREVYKIFDFFQSNYKRVTHRELIVSPFNVRRKFHQLIDNEIKNAKAGKDAYILIKLNNLVDEEMINKLYKASNAGVKIKMIIRGICSLVPGVKDLSENIEVISILDRFLEHSRILVFANAGDEKVYLCSADWMGRNLDRRVEVAAPVLDPEHKQDLLNVMNILLSDNTKARIIDQEQKNEYKSSSGEQIRSQKAIYDYYAERAKANDE